MSEAVELKFVVHVDCEALPADHHRHLSLNYWASKSFLELVQTNSGIAQELLFDIWKMAHWEIKRECNGNAEWTATTLRQVSGPAIPFTAEQLKAQLGPQCEWGPEPFDAPVMLKAGKILTLIALPHELLMTVPLPGCAKEDPEEKQETWRDRSPLL